MSLFKDARSDKSFINLSLFVGNLSSVSGGLRLLGYVPKGQKENTPAQSLFSKSAGCWSLLTLLRRLMTFEDSWNVLLFGGNQHQSWSPWKSAQISLFLRKILRYSLQLSSMKLNQFSPLLVHFSAIVPADFSIACAVFLPIPHLYFPFQNLWRRAEMLIVDRLWAVWFFQCSSWEDSLTRGRLKHSAHQWPLWRPLHNYESRKYMPRTSYHFAQKLVPIGPNSSYAHQGCKPASQDCNFSH